MLSQIPSKKVIILDQTWCDLIEILGAINNKDLPSAKKTVYYPSSQ
jgi:hypothetical protein